MTSETNIFPIILCGGSGSRLWPISRPTMPKQFAKLLENETLFEKTVKRFKHKNFADPIIVSSENSRFIIKNQLAKINSNFSRIIIEPYPKDTAAAALSGILQATQLAKDPLVIICPSDHYIKNDKYFKNFINKSKHFVSDDNIIIFGIKPKFPHTGYGWIQTDYNRNNSTINFLNVKKFIEKPPLKEAKTLFKSSKNFWNMGLFMGKASVLINAYKKFLNLTYRLTKESLENSERDLEFIRLDKDLWKKIKKVSFDNGIIEKHDNIKMVPFEEYWSDIGSFISLKEYYQQDKLKNAVVGNATLIDSQNSFLQSVDNQIHMVGLGLENIIAIASKDAVLCINQSKSEEVKKAVDFLVDKNIEQAKKSLNDFRPWGNFEILSRGKNFQVKKIQVYPNSKLSLQSHKFRSEHWVVVEGKAFVTLGEKKITLKKNESIYINSGIKHRLENKTNKTITIIEIQTGNYLGEDDIFRYEDDYRRNN